MNQHLIDPAGATSSPHKGEDVCLANARLVLPDEVVIGRIEIAEGKIVDLIEGDDAPAGSVDCGGDYVLPGLVELHTDNLERHIEPRPGVDWPHRAALVAHDRELAATGISTVFDAMRVGSITNTKARYAKYARTLADELLETRARGDFQISHFLHLRAEVCSETLLEEMAEFDPSDRVGIVSLMDHTPGQRQFRDLSQLKLYLSKKRGFTDAEFDEHVENLKDLQRRFGAKHEAGAVKEALRLNAVLASHDDTTADQVATSKANRVTFAEFPTTVEAAQACRSEGIAVMMGAPNLVRGFSHSGNVSALDLAREGLLDILSSDYVPSALLFSTFRLAEVWDDLPRAVACVTKTPAEVTGLVDRGTLELGKRGDIIRVANDDGLPLMKGLWSEGRRV